MLGCPEWHNAEVLTGWTQLEHLFFFKFLFYVQVSFVAFSTNAVPVDVLGSSEAWKFRISIRKNCCFGNVFLTWARTGGSDGIVRIWELKDLDFHGSGAASPADLVTDQSHHWELSPVERLDLEMSRLWWFAPWPRNMCFNSILSIDSFRSKALEHLNGA